MILAGDIGGTNSRFALVEARGKDLTLHWSATWPSRGSASLVELVRRAAHECGGRPDSASFGVAGPVLNGRVQATNLPWVIDAADLALALELDHVGLINDLEANAWGLDVLPMDKLHVLHPGMRDAHGNRALISAGTGLGEAGLYFDGERHHPFACEGGHASFSPTDALEIELLEHLTARFGHVSWERVLSGPGLHTLYCFLRDTDRGEESADLAAAIASGDPAATISRAAASGTSALAGSALDLFARLYGAEAGNLALKTMATGGVYIGGGIAPKILDRLTRPAFMEAFLNKGRLNTLLATIPVRVVLDDRTALFGAARHAATNSRT